MDLNISFGVMPGAAKQYQAIDSGVSELYTVFFPKVAGALSVYLNDTLIVTAFSSTPYTWLRGVNQLFGDIAEDDILKFAATAQCDIHVRFNGELQLL